MKTIESVLRKLLFVLLLFFVNNIYSQKGNSLFENQLIIEFLDSLDKLDLNISDTILFNSNIEKKYKNIRVKNNINYDFSGDYNYIVKSKNHYLVPDVDVVLKSDSTFQVNIGFIEKYRVRRFFHFKHPFSAVSSPSSILFNTSMIFAFDCENKKWNCIRKIWRRKHRL